MSEIKIANKPYYIACSQPYILGKNQPYQVNKFIDGKKSRKITQSFADKSEADEFYNENNEKWNIDFNDLEGNIVDKEIFQTEELANECYRLNLIANKEILKSEEDEEDEEIIRELEKNFMPMKTGYSDDNFPEELTQEEIDAQEEKEEWRIEKKARREEAKLAEELYLKSSTQAMDLARNLLSSVAELYIDKKIIDKYPYIKNRMFYEEQSISNITLQIMISNKVLCKFYKEIIKFPTAKNIETLSKLQKTILDISRYQREYLSDVEKSFKSLSEDANSGKFYNDIEDTVAEEISEVDGIITTNSRQKLIEEIRNINKDSQKTKIPLSPNIRLKPENMDDIEDVSYINAGDDFEEDDKELEVDGDGLNSSATY